MRSVWSNGFNPAPAKKGGVALNGSSEKATSSKVKLMRCMKRRRQAWTSTVLPRSPGRSRRHNQATSDIQPSHISRGPSRAAQVAAKRYLSGKSSPPNAATCNTEVSLMRNRRARATKGSTISRWRLAASIGCASWSRGLTSSHTVAPRANHIVSPHMVLGDGRPSRALLNRREPQSLTSQRIWLENNRTTAGLKSRAWSAATVV